MDNQYSIRNEDIIEWLLRDERNENEQRINGRIEYRRPRIIQQRMNWFKLYDDTNFRRRFHLSKDNFIMILQKIEQRLIHGTDRNYAIPPVIQLLVVLRFYATGSFFLSVADYCGISETSAQLFVHKVSEAIASLSTEFIKFPSNSDEISKIQQGNFNISGFIRVIGAIDCFHVRIKSFGGENSELFRNRKGYFSINVQAIVNSRLEFIDLVARWPGSTHDSTIFDNSRIKAQFENNMFGNGLLLGDSGYPCLPYLLTPLQNPQRPAEVLYNEALIRTRCMVERCFGIFQRSFPVLSIGSRFRTPQKTLTLIMACAVLHNVSRLSATVENYNSERYNNLIRDLEENLHKRANIFN
ncbi:putative nuclease HARBI1 [Prorops nasuta]|uniref:putative nuclease HARBI1 n=1 Tax=Prorops nasuta TaxID=863751 RepID=UPI0034CF8F3F